MSKVSVVGPGTGEVIALGPTQLRILEIGETTSHRLGIAEITIAPHADGPPQHRHAEHDEGFYVVSGAARFTVGESSYEAPAGTWVTVPPGAPHTFANPGDEPAVLLNTFTPDLYVHYFRDVRDLLASGQAPTPEAIISVMARYATVPAMDYAAEPEPAPAPAQTAAAGQSASAGQPAAAGQPGAASVTAGTKVVTVDDIGAVAVSFTERGSGPACLLLHGGAGPLSVAAFADQLAAALPVRVITPVHPGFQGTDRPEGLDTPAGLARVYAGLLDGLDLADVTVIGNSIGGWIAAELALSGSPRIGRVILVDAVGIDVPEHPVADFFSLTLSQVADYSYHDPDKFRIDPSSMSPQQQAVMAGNRQALASYSATGMTDPDLEARLGKVGVPVLVLWGDSDRIVDPDYGRAFAAAIPGARFQLLPASGHVPQLETPEALLAAITAFTDALA
jgi:pimeloyl-ACP methyl ester carboxylesterase/mannose-6-phosphate isomerase-like protein (cupin superfamily)